MNQNTDDNNKPCAKCTPVYDIINFIIWIIITFYAIYLSFKCRHGFNFGSFLLALFFAPLYIIYHIVVESSCT